MKTRSISEMRESASPLAESLRQEVRELRAALKNAKLEQGRFDDVLYGIAQSVKAAKPLPPPKAAPGKDLGRPVTLVTQFSDWHIGLVTPASDVEGFGQYSYDTACRRTAVLVGSLARYAETMRHGYTINDCVILCTGDYVSGDIHDGLVRTNEFPAPVQAVKAGLLMASAVQSLAGVFPKVRVEFITPGNHDRLTRKPQAQAGGWNSYGYVVGSLAKEVLRNQGNVAFNLHPRVQEIVEVQGRRYLCGHGDGIIGTWGIPFYGIERKVARESKARMNMPEHRHFHKIVIGHFHTALDHEDWFVGGSLSGTDENDHKCGRHSRAHQTSWLVHPEHGEFGFTRWYLP